jgi:hypothetical protein
MVTDYGHWTRSVGLGRARRNLRGFMGAWLDDWLYSGPGDELVRKLARAAGPLLTATW